MSTQAHLSHRNVESVLEEPLAHNAVCSSHGPRKVSDNRTAGFASILGDRQNGEAEGHHQVLDR